MKVRGIYYVPTKERKQGACGVGFRRQKKGSLGVVLKKKHGPYLM